MAPDVVLRKLLVLRRLITDLEAFRTASLQTVIARHYEVEGILELLATAGADLLQHLLAEQKLLATSYRDTYRQAGIARLIPEELARRLEDAAGMRNVLVHLYDEIDLEIVHASISRALLDFPALVVALEPLARLPAG
jgi:uncharacterized protein YutE (UPF0331/DUF86 family)